MFRGMLAVGTVGGFLCLAAAGGADAHGADIVLTRAWFEPERVDVGGRARLFVEIVNRGDARAPALRIEARRGGRTVWTLRLRERRRPGPGERVVHGRRFPRRETARAGRPCYRFRIRPEGSGHVHIDPRSSTVEACLVVGDADVPGGGARGAVLEIREARFGDRPRCVPAAARPGTPAPPGPSCTYDLRVVVANTGTADSGAFTVALRAPVRGQPVGEADGRPSRRVTGVPAGARAELAFRPVLRGSGRRCLLVELRDLSPGDRIRESESVVPLGGGAGARTVCAELPGPAVIARPAAAPPSEPERERSLRVRITVTRILVGFDGDNVSPGDWWVALAARSLGDVRWRAGSSWREVRNVDSDSVITRPGLDFALTVPAERSLDLRAQIVDCDGNRPWIPGFQPALVLPAPGIVRPDCSGQEEVFERSGDPDVAWGGLRIAPPFEGRYVIRVREPGARDPLSARIELVIRTE